MSTSVVILLIVAVIIVIAIIAFVTMNASRRKNEQRLEADRARAQDLRSDATAQGAAVHDSDLEAREAALEADRARLEAEKAQARAAEAQQGVQVEEARQEDRLREADRIDPDVDTRTDDYDPSLAHPNGVPESRTDVGARNGHRDHVRRRPRHPASERHHALTPAPYSDRMVATGPSQVPAATRALRVLRYLASQTDPVPLDRIARACDLPRSTAYHLVNTMIDEGFVTHLADDHRYGLGIAAFEVGSGYARQEPLQRVARRPLAALVDRTGQSAHLAVLHGRDVLYVLEERAPGRPPLVTGVGVRLPAQLTASGRAILAALPAAQVRALFPDRNAFVERHGRGPTTLSALRVLLTETRQRGHAVEEGEVTPGFASVAAPVLDHNGHPVAGVACTFSSGEADEGLASRAVRETATGLSRRIGGRAGSR